MRKYITLRMIIIGLIICFSSGCKEKPDMKRLTERSAWAFSGLRMMVRDEQRKKFSELPTGILPSTGPATGF